MSKKLIEALQLNNITIVMHDWGSVIGFDYAMRHENKCKGIVFYESYLRPVNKDDISLPYQEQLLSLEEMQRHYNIVDNGSYFVQKILPQGLIRALKKEELASYLEPFAKAGSGKPLKQYLSELPHGNGANKIDALIARYSDKLLKSKLPKLMLYSVPGFITTMETVMWARENLSHLEVVEIGEELHYAQESHPELMGKIISAWLQAIEQQEELQ